MMGKKLKIFETGRQEVRKRDKQTERQADRGRWKYKKKLLFAKIKYVRNEKSLRQIKRQARRQTEGKSERETNRLRDRQTEADKQRETQTEKLVRKIQAERHIDRETGRHRDRQTDWRRQGPISIIPHIKNHRNPRNFRQFRIADGIYGRNIYIFFLSKML
jgi:hypothetical protein